LSGKPDLRHAADMQRDPDLSNSANVQLHLQHDRDMYRLYNVLVVKHV
jgi:hypothetical protein